MKIGLVQDNILWENKQFNLNSSKEYFKRAKNINIDLLLFPELSFTGFTMNTKRFQESDSYTIHYISSLCKNYNINVGIGYIEQSDLEDKGKNKYAIISSSGEVLCNYTKIHPFSHADEDKFFISGSEIVSCNINNITISPFICYDLRFPEIFQIASKTSNLIIVAANWPRSRAAQWITLLKARAIENQCYIAGVNRIGIGNNISYSGNSMIINPLGEVVAYGEDGVDDIIVGEIDEKLVEDIRNKFKFKQDRKEELYYNLSKNKITSWIFPFSKL